MTVFHSLRQYEFLELVDVQILHVKIDLSGFDRCVIVIMTSLTITGSNSYSVRSPSPKSSRRYGLAATTGSTLTVGLWVGRKYVGSFPFRNPPSTLKVGASLLGVFFPSAEAISFILVITDNGIGKILNWSRVISFPVLMDIIFTDPVLFPVGNITMQSSVLASIVLLVFGTGRTLRIPF